MADTGYQDAIPALRIGRDENFGKRKRFTLAYKLEILNAAELLKASGKGKLRSLLAREGLYSSHLSLWRKQRDAGSLGKAKRGRPSKSGAEMMREIQSLKRRLTAAERRAAQAEFLVDLQRREILARTPGSETARLRLTELVRQAEDHCTIERACRALNLSRRTYYGWRGKKTAHSSRS